MKFESCLHAVMNKNHRSRFQDLGFHDRFFLFPARYIEAMIAIADQAPPAMKLTVNICRSQGEKARRHSDPVSRTVKKPLRAGDTFETLETRCDNKPNRSHSTTRLEVFEYVFFIFRIP